MELAEHAQRTAAEIRPGRIALVAGEDAVEHADATAANEHGATASALDRVAGAVSQGEVEALDGELWLVLVLAVITIVTRPGPQLKVMIPASATASTTACEVQLAGVPAPTT